MRGEPRNSSGFEEKIVQVNRVSKKTKGGNKIGFSVLAVVGDKKGRVGVGLGGAPDIIFGSEKSRGVCVATYVPRFHERNNHSV